MTQDRQNFIVKQGVQLFTVSEAADALHIHPSTLRRFIRRGDLPIVRVGTAIRIEVEALRQFIDRRRFKRVLSALRSNSWANVDRAWEQYERGENP